MDLKESVKNEEENSVPEIPSKLFLVREGDLESLSVS